MIRLLILAVSLAATWLIWSGLYKPVVLGLGVLSVILTLWLAVRMNLLRREVFALDLAPRMVLFWLGLLVDIVKSNLVVARIILTPKMPISPRMVELEPGLEGLVGQATLANSITLTPSTVTLDNHEGRFVVHCLTEASARDTEANDLGVRVKKALGDR